MRVIYKPKGRAGEYSEYALNIGRGCKHGCHYCYVPAMTRQSPSEFRQEFTVKKDLFKRLELDLQEMYYANIKTPVLLCFINDPYQSHLTAKITSDCMDLFNKFEQNFQILTKAGAEACEAFDKYKPGDMFASSLTFINKDDSYKIEPHAAHPESRIESLKIAHEKGIRTWVSFEPVLDGEQVIELFEKTKEFVDFYRLGKVSNYPSRVNDWDQFANTMVNLFKENGKDYYIKNDLAVHLG